MVMARSTLTITLASVTIAFSHKPKTTRKVRQTPQVMASDRPPNR